MTFMIAAAGTGGHVFPGLSVGEALMELGVARDDIGYVGGSRLESEVYPREGFRFLEVELAGLQRSLTTRNLRIPKVVLDARKRIAEEVSAVGVKVMLGMGGYVTIPAGMAASRTGIVFFNAEQNAEAGLANRVSRRWARRTFVSFPETGGIPNGEWVGNPVRRRFWDFDRQHLLAEAQAHYDLAGSRPVIGVFGGSLGAGTINNAVSSLVRTWGGPPITIVHLAGERHVDDLPNEVPGEKVEWVRVGFERRMELFYAVCDLVISRAGGAVAELTACGVPAVLIPGDFGSSGHQLGNARFLERSGAGVVVTEEHLDGLAGEVVRLVESPDELGRMRVAAEAISKPEAALTIASALIEAAA